MLNFSTMNTLILTIFIIAFAMLIMSIGIIFSNIELKGSCGGEKEDCQCSLKEMVKCKLKANP